MYSCKIKSFQKVRYFASSFVNLAENGLCPRSFSLQRSSHQWVDRCPSRLTLQRCASSYQEVYRQSLDDPETFWNNAAKDVSWFKKSDKVLDFSNPPFHKWFVGGEINTCYNAVDRHIESRGDQAALIYDSPVTSSKQIVTYRELLEKVSTLAGVLSNHGVKQGDRVLIYMPMIPEAVVSMLACARIGAIHCLVFGGFAARELSTRINHCKPKVILSANCGIEKSAPVKYEPIVTAALEMADHQPTSSIYLNRADLPQVDISKEGVYCFEEEMSKAKPHDCVPLDSNSPLYILYTSGTTGLPKAIVRPHAGYTVALHWTMQNQYGVSPGEVWWSPSDLGWIVGHSYVCYAPLIHGNTTIIYEGKPVGTPDASAYYRVISEHNVSTMFVAPTAIRSVRQEDEHALKNTYNLDCFRTMFVAGEHCDEETMDWAKKTFKVPVLDNWWQTETGWAITSTCVGLGNDLYPPVGVTGYPMPGWNVDIFRPEDGTACQPGELGDIVVKLPLPPGFALTLWEADERYANAYFSQYKGYYHTMDAGYRDAKGYVYVMARTDDVINVSGHRLSTSHLEEGTMRESCVSEAAVVGVHDDLKGQVPVGLCVLKSGFDLDESVVQGKIVAAVREHVGPVAGFKHVAIVSKLPKTRSGKIARNTIAAIAEGKPYKIPATIEDASIYPELEEALRKIGFPKA